MADNPTTARAIREIPILAELQVVREQIEERALLLEAMRAVRDNSTSHADAIAIAKTALAEIGIVPEPSFEETVTEMIDELSLGRGMQKPAAREAVTQQMPRGEA